MLNDWSLTLVFTCIFSIQHSPFTINYYELLARKTGTRSIFV
jgi:hypothetical protein